MSPRVPSIALLDSGVNAQHPHLAGARFLSGFSVEDSSAGPRLQEGTEDCHGHGTALAAAILRFHPGLPFLPVRVLDERLRTSSASLVTAMDEAVGRGARVLNLSLGSESPESVPLLKAAVERVARSGAVVVAACAPLPRSSWPADLPGVVSVRWDPDCPPPLWYSLREVLLSNEGELVPLPRFAAHGHPRPASLTSEEDNFAGSSLACARLTAAIASLLCKTPSLSFPQLLDRLLTESAGPLPPHHRLR